MSQWEKMYFRSKHAFQYTTVEVTLWQTTYFVLKLAILCVDSPPGHGVIWLCTFIIEYTTQLYAYRSHHNTDNYGLVQHQGSSDIRVYNSVDLMFW